MDSDTSNDPSSKHDHQNHNYEIESEPSQDAQVGQISRKSGILNVVVSGLALFSDGYNAQNSKFNLTALFQLRKI